MPAPRYSTPLRNAKLDQIETTIGPLPILRIYEGAQPAALTDAPSTDLVVQIALPANWMNDAAAGAKTKLGAWQANAESVNAPFDVDPGYFRILEATGATTHIQGTVTVTGGGGTMTIDNDQIASGQQVTVTGFTLTDGNP